jgi:Signal transduction histidine kinase
LEPNAAQAIAVTLHELTTNCIKYGALSVAKGQIDLTWSHEADGRLILRWTEFGGPMVQRPTHHGFGSRVIERMIGQLKGKAHFDWRREGLNCEIILYT